MADEKDKQEQNKKEGVTLDDANTAVGAVNSAIEHGLKATGANDIAVFVSKDSRRVLTP